MMGYTIISPREIKKYYKAEAIIITTFTYETQVKEKLKAMCYPKERIISLYKG